MFKEIGSLLRGLLPFAAYYRGVRDGEAKNTSYTIKLLRLLRLSKPRGKHK